jgi:hypothetical protein
MTEKKAQFLAWLRLLEAIVVIFTMPILLGLGAWAMTQIVEHDRDIAVLQYDATRGSKYTVEMAERDLEPLVEKVNDHELRIRELDDRVDDLEKSN